MKGTNPECRLAERDLLHRDELDAPTRSRLDVHLRRCPGCLDVAGGLAKLEAGPLEMSELDDQRKRVIFNRLVPTVHEIASRSGKRPSFSWRDWLDSLFSLFSLRPWYRVMVAGAAIIALALFVGLGPVPSAPSGWIHETPGTASGQFHASGTQNVEVEGIVNQQAGTVSLDGKDIGESGTMTVRRGSRIQVDENSWFSFQIRDIAKVALEGATNWQVTKISETFLGMHLQEGRLAVDFDGKSGRVMEVVTPQLLVRVKGTIFTVEAMPDGVTRVGVVEGVVEVLPRSGDVRVIEVVSGQLVSVPGAGALVEITDHQRSLAAGLEFADGYPEAMTRLVRFSGSPKQVKVEVDGRVFGSTPLTVRAPSGPFTYVLTSPGMEPAIGKVKGGEGFKEIEYNLSPATDYNPFEVRIRAKAKATKREKRRKQFGDKTGKAGGRRANRVYIALYKRAKGAMTAGDIPYAIGLLEKANEDISGDHRPKALALLAECYAAAGKFQEAVDTFVDVIESAPTSDVAQNARYEVGRLAMDRLGNYARAREAFGEYVASPSGGALREEAYYSLCELDGKQGAHRSALACFSRFLLIFPTGHHIPDARLWRGALYQDVERRWGEAERDLLAFIRARPGHPRTDEARYRVALGRYQQGNGPGSLRMIGEYLAEHPKGQYRLRLQRLRRALLAPETTP